MNDMKTRYRLTFRGIRGGMFYCVDKLTGKRTSLQTTNKDEAQQIVEAKNNSLRQPVLNLQIAKAYLAGTDNGIATRTWQQALDSLANTKQGANQDRWRTVAKDKALALLLPRVIIETQRELLPANPGSTRNMRHMRHMRHQVISGDFIRFSRVYSLLTT